MNPRSSARQLTMAAMTLAVSILALAPPATAATPKRGGTLTVDRHEVELEVTAGDIPDHITVDLTGREIGDVIHIGDIELPKGATPTIKRNFVIANLAAPSGLRSAGDDAEDGEGEAGEE